MARHHQIVEAEANSLINLGQDYVAHREGEKAHSYFREAELIFDRDEWLRWRFRDIRFHGGSAEHWLSQGDVERADGHARELLKNATHHKVPKYIAIAHKLFAELAAARGQFAEAEAELEASLEQLRLYPVPIVTWKIYAALGRLRLQLGEVQSAHAAFAQAASIINSIAAGINDERLKSVFLNSEVIRAVLKRKI
jgi:tetratricopeptide (TPR) repeat protein